MTTTTGHSNRRLIRPSTAAFTLTEMMVTLSLTALVAGAILGSVIFVARSAFGIANYSDMNREARLGLETFGRDVRSAEAIHAGFDDTAFTIDVRRPDESPDPITYIFLPDDPDRPLVRITAGEERRLITGIENLAFSYNDLQGNPAVSHSDVKQMRLQLKMVREAAAIPQTERVVSARYILRNKRVSN